MSRQQQRQQERGLLKQGEAALKAGLAVAPKREDALAIAFVLRRKLAGAEPDRASRAAEAALGVSEASARRHPGSAKLACQKGCNWCCHNWVGASAPEIFLIAEKLQREAGSRERALGRILPAARALGGLSPAERFGRKLACPLLADVRCSQYKVRPLVCRQTTSLDIAGCVEEFEGRGLGGEIKVSAVHLAHARNARIPLLAALRSVGLPTRLYELAAGLVRVIETDDAELRWLAGENVLEGCGEGQRDAAAILEAVEALVRELPPLST